MCDASRTPLPRRRIVLLSPELFFDRLVDLPTTGLHAGASAATAVRSGSSSRMVERFQLVV